MEFFSKKSEFAEHDIYIADRWEGVKLYSQQFGEKVIGDPKQIEKERYSDELILKELLKNMEIKLKNDEPMILILRNLESADEIHHKDVNLINAIRSWIYDSQILDSKSLIIIFTSDLDSVIDGNTSNLIPLIKPKISSNQERRFTIRNTVNNLLKKEAGISQKIEDREINELERITSGLNILQLKSVLIETFLTQEYRKEELTDRILDIREVIRGKANIVKRSKLLEIYEPSPIKREPSDKKREGGFENVGGYPNVKEYIERNITEAIENKEAANKLGASLIKGILFFGPPGTGKTVLSKALAEEIKIPFLKLNTENLFSKYLGESGKRFKEVIQICDEMSPAIVFIDEIDRFGKRRGESGDSAAEETRRVFNQILEWLGDERRKAIIIGTTNRPKDLDNAFLRPGRIDEKIPIFFPDEDARKAILKIHLGMIGNKRE
ncbi:MAG: AAA family ATPase, partial [Candidatus Aminicenantes bacterium]|nr:AAA family ATPase [Candidatus Aminicenantes bacterium]